MLSPSLRSLAALSALTETCPRFPVSVLFPDVEPEVLASEAAHEATRASRPNAGHLYLHRVLPALERHEAGAMAQALLSGGPGPHASRSHAERMRRQAIASGDVRRARFWADVAEALGQGRPG